MMYHFSAKTLSAGCTVPLWFEDLQLYIVGEEDNFGCIHSAQTESFDYVTSIIVYVCCEKKK